MNAWLDAYYRPLTPRRFRHYLAHLAFTYLWVVAAVLAVLVIAGKAFS